MSALWAFALRRVLPVVLAEALLLLLRSLRDEGVGLDDAAAEAFRITAEIERGFPDWSPETRSACARARIRDRLRELGDGEPDRATVEGLYGLAIQRFRQDAGTTPAQPPAR